MARSSRLRAGVATPHARPIGAAPARLLLTVLAVALVLAAPARTEAAPDRPAQFVYRVAKALIAAARTNSIPAMTQTIRSHADIPSIGMYSLGNYARRLKRARRAYYYSGMTRFMARYFMNQFRSYQVVRLDILGRSFRNSDGIMVDTRVTLRNGSTYSVRWWLVRRGRSFKVRDAQVLFFWILPYQRDLFVNYIEEKGGSVNALVQALGG